jgi:L-amino acid N-acyltransferase YncA
MPAPSSIPAPGRLRIRHADAKSDAAPCRAIYAPHVSGSAVSFEEELPEVEQFADRIDTLSRTHSFLVADHDDEIAGYAYACPHRSRPGYRWAVETSVYVRGDRGGLGIGSALYSVLLDLIERQGYRVALAGIRMPNSASIRLHAKLGFSEVGVFTRVGWTAGAWQDVAWMSRHLGPDRAESEAPPEPGPAVRLDAPVVIAVPGLR